MKKHIAEDLPARRHPQASLSVKKDNNRDEKSSPGRDGDKEKTPENKVKQAVYDIRYRARREDIPLRQAYSQYVQNSSMSEADKLEVRNKLFGKTGTMGEDYKIKELASENVANALFKVFVDKPVIEKTNEEYLQELRNKVESASGKKYKVRVTDKSGTSYVRYANREKINSLRGNPNIESVEMTEYGEPYEGERTKGEKTAKVLAKKDYDRDGKKESPAKEYRGAVHNAIQRKKGGNPDGQDTSNVKEDFLHELNDEKTIDVMKGKKNKVNVSPSDKVNETAYHKFMNMLQEKKMTKSEVTKEKKLKAKYDPSGMKASMVDQYGPEKGKKVYFATIRKQAMKEESDCGCDDDKMNIKKDEKMDSRAIPTAVSLAKLGARYRGIKNPIMMVSAE